MTFLAVLGTGGQNFPFFDPTHNKIQCLMNNLILEKVEKYEMVGF